MDRSRLELDPGVWLDARRALWLAEERALVVADLHLGYVWSHRARGNLLPLTAQDDTVDRLLQLVEDYAPAQVVLLGDIVHAADPLPPLLAEMKRLCAQISARAQLHFVRGNHDRQLEALLEHVGFASPLYDELRLGPHCLLHGDECASPGALAENGRLIFGHEHPAIPISDGVMSPARFPCFLAAPGALLLPAFTRWAAGGNATSGRFLSPLAQSIAWERAFAILAGKLLPVRL